MRVIAIALVALSLLYVSASVRRPLEQPVTEEVTVTLLPEPAMYQPRNATAEACAEGWCRLPARY